MAHIEVEVDDGGNIKNETSEAIGGGLGGGLEEATF